MTTHVHHPHPLPHRSATTVGAVLALAPLLAGLAAALLALGGRFGGPGSVVTAFWYVAAAAAPLAFLAVLVLLLAHWHDSARPGLVAWSALTVGGWVFGLGSAQVSGLADAAGSPPVWQYVLLALGIVAYLIGVAGLSRTAFGLTS